MEAELTDEGGQATLIIGLEMKWINDYEPRPSYLCQIQSR